MIAELGAGPVAPVRPDDWVEKEVSIPSRKIGMIIGPKGSTLQSIVAAAGEGVRIEMPDRDREATDTAEVKVSGSEPNVDKACRAIKDLVSKGYSRLLAGPDFKEASLRVHPRFTGMLIGDKGSSIRAIEGLGVKMNIPKVDRDSDAHVRVTVAGPKEAVNKAKQVIKDITTYYHSEVTHPGVVHKELDVPSERYSVIIGSKGSTIKHIQNSYKVKVNIPRDDEDVAHDGVLVVGTPEAVDGAEKYVQKVLEEADAKDAEYAAKRAEKDAEWEKKRAEEDAAYEAERAERKAKGPRLPKDEMDERLAELDRLADLL